MIMKDDEDLKGQIFSTSMRRKNNDEWSLSEILLLTTTITILLLVITSTITITIF